MILMNHMLLDTQHAFIAEAGIASPTLHMGKPRSLSPVSLSFLPLSDLTCLFLYPVNSKSSQPV